MPFLRFSRDRRGYENTYLLRASPRRGKQRPSLLYWFRTPPHVKVGRAPFDEDAIRMLEELHPDVQFDWAEILTARAPVEEAERKPVARPRGRAGREQARAPAARRTPDPDVPPVPVIESPEPRPVERLEAPPPQSSDQTAGRAAGTTPPSESRFVRVFDRDTPVNEGSDPEQALTTDEERERSEPLHRASEPRAVELTVGAERLAELRGRYAELLVRIRMRGGDPARQQALRDQAEQLNPDSWVTEREVQERLPAFYTGLEEIHRQLGRRRRRRRRPGRAEAGSGSPAADETGASTPDGSGDDEDED